jgi:hypothetical protein
VGDKSRDDDMCCRHVRLVGGVPVSPGCHAISPGVCSDILTGILYKGGHETGRTMYTWIPPCTEPVFLHKVKV